MADALWPFEDEFGVWHTSPPNGPLSFFRLANEFHQANCPLKFQGTAQALEQLFDPAVSEPPYPVSQYPYLSLKDFVCWLQLPSDVTGTEWYFGAVYFEQNRDRKKLFAEFRELAATAGACLRSNPRFREWLWPCLQYLSQADRYPQLRDGEDIAWWVALLFTKPDLCQLIHSACARNDIADVVQFEIDNPGLWSKTAISSRQLYGDPLWPTVNCRVARPFREIPCPDFVDAPAIPDAPQKRLAVAEPAIQNLKQTALPDPNGTGVPCLVVILEQIGWRVSNNRRRRKRLEGHIEEAKTKNQPTTALEAQREELKDELARFEDLLNDCAEWIRVRTGIARDKLVEIATSTAFTEGKDRDDIYAELRKLDERGLTAELWTNLLSQDREALVSIKLLPSLESSQPTSAADEQRGNAAVGTSSPLALNAEATGSFRDQGEFVWICGFDEDVTVEKTPGVERLIAIVTASTRRVAVMELVRIGAGQQALDRGSIDDLDADGLTERESINDATKTRKRRESVLGDDASQAVRDEVGDLIAKKKTADELGDAAESKALKQQIDAILNPLKTDATNAAKTVQNSLDRTYKRLRKDGKGNRLAAHFEKCVIRPRESSEYVYQLDESERKISWIAK